MATSSSAPRASNPATVRTRTSRTFPTVWATHLQSSAAAIHTDPSGAKTGYTVEIGWFIGDLPLKNGTKIGMEFAINAASSANNANQYHLYWSNGNNKGTNDNTIWGDVVLAGYDGLSPMQLNTFMLRQNIKKATPSDSSATGLVRGIWKDESAVDRALAAANAALQRSASQAEIDSANAALDSALRALRRTGKYPDPYDLPVVKTLPDPFTFLNGQKVRTAADWDKRRGEIKELAQYYEYGYMPAEPQSLTAVSTNNTGGAVASRSIAITIQDRGKTASFTPVLFLPPTGTAPYPVIVQQDARSSPNAQPNRAFTQAGYAVLSIPTSDNPAMTSPGVASDDGNHTGAFYTLYPYKLDREGNDHGVLLAWAWGASRGVDALEYLAAHDPSYANLLDLSKLVVTGFSRWGKAALLTGFLDDRFKVTAPGGSGSGGAAPYRYDSFGNRPFRSAPFGNLYPWGRSTGAETLGDHVRHQTHNSNEMIRRFLNDIDARRGRAAHVSDSAPGAMASACPSTITRKSPPSLRGPSSSIIRMTITPTMPKATPSATKAPCPYSSFSASRRTSALDLYMGGGGHSLKPSQAANIVNFANMVLFGKPLPDEVKKRLTTDPYVDAGTYQTYYGGLQSMMPWAATAPK